MANWCQCHWLTRPTPQLVALARQHPKPIRVTETVRSMEIWFVFPIRSAIPADEKHTFIPLYNAYDYGFAPALAMQTYLASSGRKKVGFTVEG